MDKQICTSVNVQGTAVICKPICRTMEFALRVYVRHEVVMAQQVRFHYSILF